MANHVITAYSYDYDTDKNHGNLYVEYRDPRANTIAISKISASEIRDLVHLITKGKNPQYDTDSQQIRVETINL